MAFYIRKGLNFGPLRLNLSKSGFGLSAGITGARIGLNSQGKAYVHGGRHGLYYRKSLGSVHKELSSSKTYRTRLPEIEIFSDTGWTYPQTKTQEKELQLPSLQKPLTKAPWIFLGLFLIWFISAPSLIPSMGILVAGIFVFIWQNNRKQNQLIKQGFESLKDLPSSLQTSHNWKKNTQGLKETNQSKLAFHIAFCWLENQLSSEEIKKISELSEVLPLEKSKLKKLTVQLYQSIVEETLADHQLSPAEEVFLEKIEYNWEIPSDKIKEEKNLVAKFSELRKIHELDLPLLTFSRPLVRGEKAFFEGEGRFLNRRILQSWQENNQRIKEVGYQIDLEGILRISDRQIEIQEGKNLRSYSIKNIQDITLSLEDGIIELSIANRKNCVILTSPELIKVSGIIHKLTLIES